MSICRYPEREEFEHYFYQILIPEIEKREKKLKELAQETIEVLKRVGVLVMALRSKLDLTRREFTVKSDLPLLWIDLVERGCSLPEDMTDENVKKVDHIFHQIFPQAAHFSHFVNLDLLNLTGTHAPQSC